MSRDNVSEMARVMCGRDKDCLLCPVQTPCLMRNCAELLNAEGYRKASEVAREIFEEMIQLLSMRMGIKEVLAELKKKYTEEITEEGK